MFADDVLTYYLATEFGYERNLPTRVSPSSLESTSLMEMLIPFRAPRKVTAAAVVKEVDLHIFIEIKALLPPRTPSPTPVQCANYINRIVSCIARILECIARILGCIARISLPIN